MTRDDIIRMAREVGILDFRDEDGSEYVKDVLDDLERFAVLVAAKAAEKEREACAKVVYSATDYLHEEGDMILKELIATAIRARGNSETK